MSKHFCLIILALVFCTFICLGDNITTIYGKTYYNVVPINKSAVNMSFKYTKTGVPEGYKTTTIIYSQLNKTDRKKYGFDKMNVRNLNYIQNRANSDIYINSYKLTSIIEYIKKNIQTKGKVYVVKDTNIIPLDITTSPPNEYEIKRKLFNGYGNYILHNGNVFIAKNKEEVNKYLHDLNDQIKELQAKKKISQKQYTSSLSTTDKTRSKNDLTDLINILDKQISEKQSEYDNYSLLSKSY